MDNGGLTTGDLALMNNGGFGGENGFAWIFGLLILMGIFNGGYGNNAALGYQNLATQNDVQRGFDTAALQDQSRDILGAVTNGTAQSISATKDAQMAISSQIADVKTMEQNILGNQAECCCSTKMLISETGNKILEALAQNKIEALQAQVNQLQLQQATAGMLRFPNSWTYGAGPFPPIFGGGAANI